MGPQKRNTNKNMLFVVVVLLFGIDVAFSQLDLCARRSFDKCELFPGDSFDGAFPNNDLENLSGKKFTLTIAQDNYGIIASEHSTVFTKLAWAEELIDGRIVDTLTITDQVGLPDAHACIDSDGNAEVGKYELSWHKNCLLATLTRIEENCDLRSRLWNEQTHLLKKPCRGPADGICSIQERTVWTGKNGDAREWFVFGGNDAYVETAIAADGARTSYFGRVALNDKRTKHSSSSTSDDDDTEQSYEVTFGNSLLGLNELGSDGAAEGCGLRQSAALYHARGLELTSDELTEGTYSALHGVYDRSHRVKFSTSSTTDKDTYVPKALRRQRRHRRHHRRRHRRHRRLHRRTRHRRRPTKCRQSARGTTAARTAALTRKTTAPSSRSSKARKSTTRAPTVSRVSPASRWWASTRAAVVCRQSARASKTRNRRRLHRRHRRRLHRRQPQLNKLLSLLPL